MGCVISTKLEEDLDRQKLEGEEELQRQQLEREQLESEEEKKRQELECQEIEVMPGLPGVVRREEHNRRAELELQELERQKLKNQERQEFVSIEYVATIKSYDKKKKGFLRMYRVMSEAEAEAVRANGGYHAKGGKGGLVTREGNENAWRQEIWLSTSIKHSRGFQNKGVEDKKGERPEEVCMAFKVNLDKFGEQFATKVVHQDPTKNPLGQTTRDALGDVKNFVHNEKLTDHPWKKMNFCVRGYDNAEKFNQCIEGIDELVIKRETKAIYQIDPNEEQLLSVRSSQSEYDQEHNPEMELPLDFQEELHRQLIELREEEKRHRQEIELQKEPGRISVTWEEDVTNFLFD